MKMSLIAALAAAAFGTVGCVHSIRPQASELADAGVSASATLSAFYGELIERTRQTGELRVFNDAYSGIGSPTGGPTAPPETAVDCTSADFIKAASAEQRLVCRITFLTARKRLAESLKGLYMQLGAVAAFDAASDAGAQAQQLAASIDSATRMADAPDQAPNYDLVSLATKAIVSNAQNKKLSNLNSLVERSERAVYELVVAESSIYDQILLENSNQRGDLVKQLVGKGHVVVWPALQQPLVDAGLKVANPEKAAGGEVDAAFLRVFEHREKVRRAAGRGASTQIAQALLELNKAHQAFPEQPERLTRALAEIDQLAVLVAALKSFGKPPSQ